MYEVYSINLGVFDADWPRIVRTEVHSTMAAAKRVGNQWLEEGGKRAFITSNIITIHEENDE